MAKYRKRLSKSRSKKMFSRSADRTPAINLNTAAPMRGGIRL